MKQEFETEEKSWVSGMGYVKETRKNIYRDAIRCWGADSQIMMAVEEMDELLQALSKVNRKVNGCDWRKVVEEIVDVEIMMEELKVIFCPSESVLETIKGEKLGKLSFALAKCRKAGKP